ncbi:hypothetical protein PO229_26190, partial [Bacteroides ovatus]|uniref:hypothetical protein n=1 Tax=Bacteroides ovatus TaxID=28116 RepID=UPI00233E671E
MSQLGKRYSLTKSNRKVYTLFISDSVKEGFNLGFSISFKKGTKNTSISHNNRCLLYTSDAADEVSCVDL